jgi:hypothetical protein
MSEQELAGEIKEKVSELNALLSKACDIDMIVDMTRLDVTQHSDKVERAMYTLTITKVIHP